MSSKDISLVVDFCAHDAVVYACKNWHYSKTVPVPPLVKIGVWENGEFVGCVIFSRGASSNLLKPYGLSQEEGCELTRVALRNHKSTVSKILKFAIMKLKKICPGVKLIVSFADPEEGHVGGIYQASNWVYCGETAKANVYYYKGRKLHSRQVSQKGWNIQQGVIRKTIKPSECIVKQTRGKYRYLFPLDDEVKKRIAVLSKPYPKRAKRLDLEDHSKQGGSLPTRSLQE